MYCLDNPDVVYDNFFGIFAAIYPQYFPLKSKLAQSESSSKPYITREIKHLINGKNKLERTAAIWPLTYKEQLKRARNALTRIIRDARNIHYRSKLNSAANSR